MPFGAGGQAVMSGRVEAGRGRIRVAWTCAWSRSAMWTSSASEVTCIFAITWARWAFTVRSEVPSSAAITLLAWPAVTRVKTECSRGVRVRPLEVGGQVFVAQLLPLATGMGVRLLRPALADRIAGPLGKGALALMLALVVLVLVDGWRALTEPGWWPTLAIVLLTVGALLAGHLLGGPEPATRTILAVASAARYPALCFLVIALNYPRMGVEGVVITYWLLAALARMPYIAWRRRQAALSASEAKAGPPGEESQKS